MQGTKNDCRGGHGGKGREEKDHAVHKALLGYDPEKWLKTDAETRAEELEDSEYQSLNLTLPTKGKHRFAHCQILYEEVHAFLNGRRWAPAQVDSDVGGVTWVELFALFDTGGNRSEAGQHSKNPEATKRAKERQEKARSANANKMGISDTTVAAKPTLDE